MRAVSFTKRRVVREPTGDGVKPESVCTLESSLAAVSLGPPLKMEIQKVNRRLEYDFEKISATPIMENNEFIRQRLAPPASHRGLPLDFALQAGLQPNNLTPEAPLWQRTVLCHQVSSFC